MGVWRDYGDSGWLWLVGGDVGGALAWWAGLDFKWLGEASRCLRDKGVIHSLLIRCLLDTLCGPDPVQP